MLTYTQTKTHTHTYTGERERASSYDTVNTWKNRKYSLV